MSETSEKLEKAKALYRDKEYIMAMAIFMTIADNEPEAANYIGELYYHGLGTDKNLKQAFEWYQKSAMQGNVLAQNNLGVMYKNGEAVEKDYYKAFELYQKSAMQGNIVAQCNLANMYRDGKGTEKNIEEALKWYQKSADNGNSDAASRIEELKESKDYIEMMLNKYMAEFSGYNIDPKSLSQIRMYFRYRMEKHDDLLGTPCNFMIHCSDDALSLKFVRTFYGILEKVSGRKIKLIESAVKFTRDKKEEPSKALSCYQFVVSKTGDTDGKLNLLPRNFESTTNILKIISGAEADIKMQFASNDHMYFRVFKSHIYISNMENSEIKEKFHKLLQEKKYSETEKFTEEIDRYIDVVYPKADLKNDSFVKDLYERVEINYFSGEDRDGTLDEKCVPYYRRNAVTGPLSYEEAAAELENMVGMDKLKDIVRSIADSVQYEKMEAASGIKSSPRNLNMIFSGNPGTGKTCVAKMMADILNALGVLRTNKLICAERKDLVAGYIGQTAIRTKEFIDKAMDGVLFIDEAYSLTSSDSPRDFGAEAIDTLITAMNDYKGRLVVIFAGYRDEMERFRKSNPGIDSRVGYTVEFEDYSADELTEIFRRKLEKDGYSVSDEALAKVRGVMEYYCGVENFGNGRFVEKVIDKTKNIHMKNKPDPENFRIIGENDVPVPEDLADSVGALKVYNTEKLTATPKSYEEVAGELEALVGLQRLKQEIKRFGSAVRLMSEQAKQGKELPPLKLNMIFMGNPGTGKTTVARMIADILNGLGVLKTNKVISVERKDLIGKYLGHTEARTAEVIKSALDGVLFIDEAYSLTQSDYGRDYGHQVINCLLPAMNDYSDRLVVIFAGYEKEMGQFVDSNPGIASRIGYTFHFDDYNTEELVHIFINKTAGLYTISDKALERVRDVMENARKVPNFGNGRFVDNLITRISIRYADRHEDYGTEMHIEPDDVPDWEELKQTMGDAAYEELPVCTDEDKRRLAVHEAGHVIVSYILNGRNNYTLVSLNYKNGKYGHKIHRDIPDIAKTEKWAAGQVASLMAGKNAESLIFGDYSMQFQYDLKKAKTVAADMVDKFAFGDSDILSAGQIIKNADEASSKILEEYEKELRDFSGILYENTEMDEEKIESALKQVFEQNQQGED